MRLWTSSRPWTTGCIDRSIRGVGHGRRQIGDLDEALRIIGEALDDTEQTGERWSEAEIHRLKGTLLLRQETPEAAAQAEVCFERSLQVARGQSAKAWELRTATSLARLWVHHGRLKQAQELLAPVYDWFTEGFETPDLLDAKALLDELNGCSRDGLSPRK